MSSNASTGGREPRAPTIGRQRILAERDSITRQLMEWTEAFAGPAPAQNRSRPTDCRGSPRLCYGRGDNFDLIGRWTDLVCALLVSASSSDLIDIAM
jgi:hypothetical protein